MADKHSSKTTLRSFGARGSAELSSYKHLAPTGQDRGTGWVLAWFRVFSCYFVDRILIVRQKRSTKFHERTRNDYTAVPSDVRKGFAFPTDTRKQLRRG